MFSWEDNLACGKYLSNVANAIAHITQQNTAWDLLRQYPDSQLNQTSNFTSVLLL